MNQEQPKKTGRRKNGGKPEKAYLSDTSFRTDPLGSYTGRPEDGETPVQDADDL